MLSAGTGGRHVRPHWPPREGTTVILRNMRGRNRLEGLLGTVVPFADGTLIDKGSHRCRVHVMNTMITVKVTQDNLEPHVPYPPRDQYPIHMKRPPVSTSLPVKVSSSTDVNGNRGTVHTPVRPFPQRVMKLAQLKELKSRREQSCGETYAELQGRDPHRLRHHGLAFFRELGHEGHPESSAAWKNRPSKKDTSNLGYDWRLSESKSRYMDPFLIPHEMGGLGLPPHLGGPQYGDLTSMDPFAVRLHPRLGSLVPGLDQEEVSPVVPPPAVLRARRALEAVDLGHPSAPDNAKKHVRLWPLQQSTTASSSPTNSSDALSEAQSVTDLLGGRLKQSQFDNTAPRDVVWANSDAADSAESDVGYDFRGGLDYFNQMDFRGGSSATDESEAPPTLAFPSDSPDAQDFTPYAPHPDGSSSAEESDAHGMYSHINAAINLQTPHRPAPDSITDESDVPLGMPMDSGTEGSSYGSDAVPAGAYSAPAFVDSLSAGAYFGAIVADPVAVHHYPVATFPNSLAATAVYPTQVYPDFVPGVEYATPELTDSASGVMSASPALPTNGPQYNDYTSEEYTDQSSAAQPDSWIMPDATMLIAADNHQAISQTGGYYDLRPPAVSNPEIATSEPRSPTQHEVARNRSFDTTMDRAAILADAVTSSPGSPTSRAGMSDTEHEALAVLSQAVMPLSRTRTPLAIPATSSGGQTPTRSPLSANVPPQIRTPTPPAGVPSARFTRSRTVSNTPPPTMTVRSFRGIPSRTPTPTNGTPMNTRTRRTSSEAMAGNRPLALSMLDQDRPPPRAGSNSSDETERPEAPWTVGGGSSATSVVTGHADEPNQAVGVGIGNAPVTHSPRADATLEQVPSVGHHEDHAERVPHLAQHEHYPQSEIRHNLPSEHISEGQPESSGVPQVEGHSNTGAPTYPQQDPASRQSSSHSSGQHSFPSLGARAPSEASTSGEATPPSPTSR